MRNRSAIWVFTILLILACIYQLSFSLVTKGLEDDAVKYAGEQWDKIRLEGSTEAVLGNDILDITVLDSNKIQKIKNHYEQEYLSLHSNDGIYPLLGISYQKCKDQQLGLGLDLQGGMSVTLEVSIPELVKNLAGSSSKPSFQEPYNQALKWFGEGKGDDFVALFDEAYKASEWSGQTMTYFNVANKDHFPVEMSNDDIIVKLSALSTEAIDKTERIIEARINKFGVNQPNIQKQPLSGRLHIELPGAKDKNRVRKLIESTASLEFWDGYDEKSLRNDFIQINNSLEKEEAGEEVVETEKETRVVPEGYNLSPDSITLAGLDSNGLKELDSINQIANNLSIESAEAAADTSSVGIEANQGPLFSKLTFVQNGTSPYLGYAKKKDTAKVSSYLNAAKAKGVFSNQLFFFWDAKEQEYKTGAGEESKGFMLYAIKKEIDGTPKISGEDIKEAFQDYDDDRRPSVTLIMKSQAASIWGEWTEDRKGHIVAIVLDNQVYSAPNIINSIKDGITQISGGFNGANGIEEAQDLANILKAGSLPAPARIVDEAIVGPSLGEENIKAGLWSFVFALVLVLIYIMFYYNKAGIVASIALVANIFFILGTLASMGAALTLPGIAGLVLTLGMSVDANVLIYERIREELRLGKGVKLALADGYKHAYSAIVDANITSLLTAVVLAYFGSGPIQGFATTLIVGIFTSLFSAIFITRLIFSYMLDKKKTLSFSSKMTENLFTNMNIGFIKKRKRFYLLSAIVVVAGITSLSIRKLDGGVEFTGGRTYRVEFSETPGQEDVRKAIAAVSIGENGAEISPEVKTVNNQSTSLEITTKYLYTDKSQGATAKVDSTLAVAFGSLGFDASGDKNFKIESQRSVDAQISNELIFSSILAIIFSLIAIFLYIAFRFQRWQWGMGALLAMFHDVLVVIGLFSLLYGIVPFSMEIDQAFIAAILTVVGYSINDTVVVFDRIREYITNHKREDEKVIVNKALNSTLSRTINTSLSTFLVLLIIFIFGGEGIRGFSFALMIGVIVGTYSSLCIASPSVLDFSKSIMPIGKKEN